MVVEPVAAPRHADVPALLDRLRTALAGGAPVAPHRGDRPPPALPEHDPAALPDDLAVVVGTSGSTGEPKLAMLGAAALTASARATHDRLGGPGQWLLALPPRHVAGVQVLVRSVDAGTTPVAMDLTPPFSMLRFAEATARLEPGARHYTALVPTQVLRLLDDPDGAEALRAFDAVLVGGAATPPALRRKAASARVGVVATYGTSETAGGCVYDGHPLDGSAVRLEDDGRVVLGGPTLAHGYLGRPDLTPQVFVTGPDGSRWFRTDDVGHLDDDGRLHVDGRRDDVVVTGGLKVAPRVVEEAVLDRLPGARDAVVVGLPDPEWGQAVGLFVVLDDGLPAPSVADVRAALRGAVPDHALPRLVLSGDAVPLRGPGKPNRRAVSDRFDVE
ncbi:AMP-binding protein [Phycicoccus sp. CSK15P-2]|uniref:o-succinylbenzoate--CoA ligase n=1 Tax=Phycicoccus sp. CSK15P-2 TaxID=2807627 RepID=UPI001951F7E6|nr:o-succinylbenzoate--CoA ligase [Phycicoccus sp. CSK15P-2]MBM6404953.1 AMP-binding protein [Phycicoccus sp. CSK15P-2]